MKTKHLGKNNAKSAIGYKILDPIERIRSSESLGYDFWNAYEFSYLDVNKQPTLKVLEIKIPVSSKFIIESKSLKLYLNSFYKKTFLSDRDVLTKIKRDLSKVSAADIELKFIKKFQAEPKSLNLNTTTRKYTQKNYPICFDGFRSICPVTSQPDFAKIYILGPLKQTI